LPDVRLIAPPARGDLLNGIRARLGHAVPGARVLAEAVLGAEARIDFVAVEPGGRVAIVLVGEHDEDLALIARGLAQRAWVAARVADWRQLAPESGIARDAPVRAVVLCPAFGAEARSALAALGPETLAAVTYRCVANGAGSEVLLEHVESAAPTGSDDPAPRERRSQFRTRLSDADLGLTAEEQREFE
jgi:hypothetical protein